MRRLMRLVGKNSVLKDDIHDKKVFIGVGHGGSDPGATSAGLFEKNINLVTALACKSELERHGVLVGMSRTTDEDDPIAQEVKECNAFKPDLAIDCHVNAGGGDGFEIFYWEGSKSGKRLSQCIESEVKSIGQNSRGLKSGKHLRFVNGTDCTAVLAESFFIDNSLDRKIADTNAEQQKFGKAYAKGILKYLGIEYKESTSKPTKLYRVQVGAFGSKSNADRLAKELVAKGYPAYVSE